jgi:hypothetical protein
MKKIKTKILQVLKALLDVRASLLDPKKLPASALGQFLRTSVVDPVSFESGSIISIESGSGSNPNSGL